MSGGLDPRRFLAEVLAARSATGPVPGDLGAMVRRAVRAGARAPEAWGWLYRGVRDWDAASLSAACRMGEAGTISRLDLRSMLRGLTEAEVWSVLAAHLLPVVQRPLTARRLETVASALDWMESRGGPDGARAPAGYAESLWATWQAARAAADDRFWPVTHRSATALALAPDLTPDMAEVLLRDPDLSRQTSGLVARTMARNGNLSVDIARLLLQEAGVMEIGARSLSVLLDRPVVAFDPEVMRVVWRDRVRNPGVNDIPVVRTVYRALRLPHSLGPTDWEWVGHALRTGPDSMVRRLAPEVWTHWMTAPDAATRAIVMGALHRAGHSTQPHHRRSVT